MLRFIVDIYTTVRVQFLTLQREHCLISNENLI